MNVESRIIGKLDQLLAGSPIIEIDNSFRGLCVSDLHMGVRDEADDFQANADLCFWTLMDHLQKGYRIFSEGDTYELWENSDLDQIVNAYPGLYDLLLYRTDCIAGNHDQELWLPQSYVLRHRVTRKNILLVHGHQGDFFCDEGYPLGWFFTRYIWRNLQMIGFKDPTTAVKNKNPKKHELTREAFHEWAFSRKQTVIFGHTHYAEADPPYYWNCGSWTGDGGQGVEIVGDQISLRVFKQEEV